MIVAVIGEHRSRRLFDARRTRFLDVRKEAARSSCPGTPDTARPPMSASPPPSFPIGD
jgi:hypothetical protein